LCICATVYTNIPILAIFTHRHLVFLYARINPKRWVRYCISEPDRVNAAEPLFHRRAIPYISVFIYRQLTIKTAVKVLSLGKVLQIYTKVMLTDTATIMFAIERRSRINSFYNMPRILLIKNDYIIERAGEKINVL